MAKNRNQASLRTRASRIGGGAILLCALLIGVLSTQRNNELPNIKDTDSPEVLETESLNKVEKPLLTEAPAETEVIEITARRTESESTTAVASVEQTASSVQYGSFQAEVEGNDGKVRWSTLFQRHIKTFEIQRSLDDENYEVIGRVDGEGSGSYSKEQVYEYIDNSLATVQMPRVYYRVKQIGFDGLEDFSDVIEYEFGLDLGLYSRIEEIQDGKIKLLYAADRTGPISLRFLNVAGEIIDSHELQADFDPQALAIDASSWKEGKYFLQLQDEATSVMEQFIYKK
ncbi:MAG: hypothetical protein R8P61_23080 [Bacteroidia bacterium]|nr:hypothetical protein [Bacteroidia bacterium]